MKYSYWLGWTVIDIGVKSCQFFATLHLEYIVQYNGRIYTLIISTVHSTYVQSDTRCCSIFKNSAYTVFKKSPSLRN